MGLRYSQRVKDSMRTYMTKYGGNSREEYSIENWFRV